MSIEFLLGGTVITANTQQTLDPEDAIVSLRRHAAGDWGALDDEDRQSNDRALKVGGRRLSAYTDRNKTKFWIVTEAGRSVTTVLLPEDY